MGRGNLGAGRPEASFGREPLGNQAKELRGVSFQACEVRSACEGQCIIMNLKQAAHHGDTHGGIVDINLRCFSSEQMHAS